MYFKFDDLAIYYEVHGQGFPLLLLNGIMMTTQSWAPFVDVLSAQHQLILVDLIDQGQSAKVDIDYTQTWQVTLLDRLLTHLNLAQVDLCGISYGGEVALQLIDRYPERVRKLILFNTPPETSYWLSDIGKSWTESLRDPLDFYYAIIPYVYSPQFYNSHEDWMENRKAHLFDLFRQPAYLAAMQRLIQSAEGYNALENLEAIQQPTLIVAAEGDMITPLYQQQSLHERIPHSQLVILPNCGHGSMYEQPELFASLILGFIAIHSEIVI